MPCCAELSLLDLAVLSLFFLSLLAASYLSHKQSHKTTSSYFLMGRKLTLPMFLGTLVSTWYGSIFGVTQIAYEEGIYNFFIQGVFWYITYLLFAWLIVPKIMDSREILTLPDLVGSRVGPLAAKVTAVFNIVDILPIAYVLSLGLFVQGVLGTPLLISMLLATLLVAGYTAVGGLRSVVYTDMVQFVTMYVGMICLVATASWKLGPFGEIWAKLPPGHRQITGSDSLGSFAVWGFIALATLIDPNFYQRCFAAKNVRTARIGIILATVFWFCFDLLTTTAALYARVHMPNHDASQAFMTFALDLLPSGLRGLFLAAILATIMSTLDSCLFTASKITIANLIRPGKNRLIAGHRALILVFAVSSVAIAPVFGGDFKRIWKFFGSLGSGCLLLPVVLSVIGVARLDDRKFCYAVGISAAGAILWEFALRSAIESTVETFYVAVALNVGAMTILPGPSSELRQNLVDK